MGRYIDTREKQLAVSLKASSTTVYCAYPLCLALGLPSGFVMIKSQQIELQGQGNYLIRSIRGQR